MIVTYKSGSAVSQFMVNKNDTGVTFRPAASNANTSPAAPAEGCPPLAFSRVPPLADYQFAL